MMKKYFSKVYLEFTEKGVKTFNSLIFKGIPFSASTIISGCLSCIVRVCTVHTQSSNEAVINLKQFLGPFDRGSFSVFVRIN